jgi:hypothetical protein
MAYVIKNEDSGIEHSVTKRHFDRLKDRDGYEPVEGEEEDETDLPSDFPGRSHLVEDGRFTTLDEVDAASDEDLDDVSRIGSSTIEDIRAYLEEE